MKKLNLLEEEKPYKTRVGFSYRSRVLIEPYLSKQWFIKMEPFKKKLIQAPEKIKIISKHLEDNDFYWIKNLRDWCISIQLWWGHQIPAYFYGDGVEDFVVAKSIEEVAHLSPEKLASNEDFCAGIRSGYK